MGDVIASRAHSILVLLSTAPKNSMSGDQLLVGLGINDFELHQAVGLLQEKNLVEIFTWRWKATPGFGTDNVARKSNLSQVNLTERGKFELAARLKAGADGLARALPNSAQNGMVRPVAPVGSPYGFTDVDWELVTTRMRDPKTLFVAVGCQYDSNHFERDRLVNNMKLMIGSALDQFHAHSPQRVAANVFLLGAGYAEHQFNQIARDVLSADLCIFEMSDLNPNVMIELGVALSWGVRVLPIRKLGATKMPSDISGQTYAEYDDNGGTFLDGGHREKVYAMVERAILKKQNR